MPLKCINRYLIKERTYNLLQNSFYRPSSDFKKQSSCIRQTTRHKQRKNKLQMHWPDHFPTSHFCLTVCRLHKIQVTILGKSPLNAASEKIALNQRCNSGVIDLCRTLPLRRDNRGTKTAKIIVPLSSDNCRSRRDP